MSPSDKAEFARAVSATMEVYAQSVSKEAVAMWWAVLQGYSLDEVKQALTAHLSDPERGRFAPRPADVIAKIPTGHPEANEAWAMVASAIGDEGATLVITEPMRTAFFAADALADDKIAARMAFLDVYRREIQNAGPPKWVTTLGHDPYRRDDALEQAVALGRLPRRYADGLLSHRQDRGEAGRALQVLSGGKK